MDKNPRLEKDEDGDYFVTWDDRGGISPTLQQKLDALKELQNRQYGQAPQMIHLEGELKAHVNQLSGELNLAGALPPAILHQMKALVLKGLTAKSGAPVTDTSDAVDAEFKDVPTVSSSEA